MGARGEGLGKDVMELFCILVVIMVTGIYTCDNIYRTFIELYIKKSTLLCDNLKHEK